MSFYRTLRPDWLTSEFLENLLQNNQDSPGAKLKINKYEIFDHVPKGNYYSSIILGITVEYNIEDVSKNFSISDQKVSLILKMPRLGGMLSELMMNGIYEKERRAYVELMPKLNDIIQSQSNNANLIPKCFHTERKVMFLEDGTSIGYKMVNRRDQLDYEHTVVTLINLANFHAASVTLHDNEPELVETFGTDRLFSKNMDEPLKIILDPLLGEKHIEMVCHEFQKWPETEKYVNFLTKLKSKVWDIYIRSLYASDDEFTVLNHGDLWIGNLMFKYDTNGRPETVKFLDFQMLRYTNPAVDILNLFYSSVRYEVLNTNFHALTDIYLEHLNLNLEKYGSPVRLTEREFKDSLKKREMYSLIQCVNLLAYTVGDFDEVRGSLIKLNESFDETPVRGFIQNERYRRICAQFLEEFSKSMWFQNFQ